MEWKRCIDASNTKSLRKGGKYLIKCENLKQSAGSLCKVICDQNGNLIGKYMHDLRFESITKPNLPMFTTEKPYRILSFKYDGYIWEKCKYAYYSHKNTTSAFETEYFFKNNAQIHSIERLSDGEVFSVGDYIASTKGFEALIVKIVISNDRVYVYGKGLGNPTTLQQIRHTKRKPIFQTHDGVDKYLGDEFVYVTSDLKNIFDRQAICLQSGRSKGFYFHTKEKAELFVEENKQQFSRNDILNIFGVWRDTSKPLKRIINEYKSK